MYKTSDIATITGIHPNTVRFYEKLGLISPVPRSEKGYRIFDERHLIQVKVLRCIFLDDWPGEAIRRASMNIVEALKVWDIATALQCSRLHQTIIEKEREKTMEKAREIEEMLTSL